MRKSAPFRFGSIAARPPFAAPRQRIGLVGGSFNPPHEAHLLISEQALKRLGLDQVWWLVTPGNPLKSRDELAPLGERMRLARAMAKDPRIKVTDFEKGLKAPFTAATLGHLRLRHRRVRFVWVMGADCLADLHRWRHWEEILAAMPIAVFDRPGWRLKALSSRVAHATARARLPESRARALPCRRPPAWTLLTGPLSPMSSTAIRAAGQGRTRQAASKAGGRR